MLKFFRTLGCCLHFLASCSEYRSYPVTFLVDVRYEVLRVGRSRYMRSCELRDRIGTYWVLVGRPEGRRPVGGPRLRWEDSFKMDLQEM
jgi:hypothetical protein